jgi:hypothetical protein
LVVDNPVLELLRRKLIPQFFRDFIKRQLIMKKRPELTAESLIKLEKVFNDDLNVLSHLTGTQINLGNYKELSKTIHINLI